MWFSVVNIKHNLYGFYDNNPKGTVKSTKEGTKIKYEGVLF